MNSLRALLIVLTTGLVTDARASFAVDRTNELLARKIFTNYVKKAEVMGITSIGGQSTASLKERAQSVPVTFHLEIEYEVEDSDGSRRNSGYWNKSAVHLSLRHLSQVKDKILGETAEGLIAHEFFGYLGVNDDNFSKSAAIMSLIEIVRVSYERSVRGEPSLFQSKDSLPLLANFIQADDGGGGGISGVGGGGDGRILLYMCMVYNELFILTDLAYITSEESLQISQKLGSIDVQLDKSVEQGDFRYQAKEKKLRVPPNATKEENVKENAKAVKTLVKRILNE